MDYGRNRVTAESSSSEATPAHTPSDGESPAANLTWIEYDPGNSSGRKTSNRGARSQAVRRQAALASAAARLATLAKKDATVRQSLFETDVQATTVNRVSQRVKQTKGGGIPSEADLNTWLRKNDAASTDMVAHVPALLESLSSTLERPNMMNKTIRTQLWTAFTSNGTLFQSALFVAGTHSNTCGVPPFAIHTGLGTGLILLRGASLNAIQSAVIQSHGDSLTSLAIALLAGWERRFGDRESYEVHIKAWRCLSLPAGALETNNISTLADLALESFREGLNDRSLIGSSAIPLHLDRGRARYLQGLPSGFACFQADRPEAISLLHLTARWTHPNIYGADAVADIRRVALENMAWGPSHTLGCAPEPADEDSWDQAELNALFHVRAAMISIYGILMEVILKANNIEWGMDLHAGFEVHAGACQHLRSEALMGTKYQEVALWARFAVCAISPNPSREQPMKSYLKRQGMLSWRFFEPLLERHFYPLPWMGTICRSYFDQLTKDA